MMRQKKSPLFFWTTLRPYGPADHQNINDHQKIADPHSGCLKASKFRGHNRETNFDFISFFSLQFST